MLPGKRSQAHTRMHRIISQHVRGLTFDYNPLIQLQFQLRQFCSHQSNARYRGQI